MSRYLKNYVITFRREKGGYPTTVLVDGFNKADAIKNTEDFIVRNDVSIMGVSHYKRGTAKFRFGEVANSIIDIRQ